MQGEELEEVPGTWQRMAARESRGEAHASHREGSVLTSAPHRLFGFTGTGQEAPSCLTGEGTGVQSPGHPALTEERELGSSLKSLEAPSCCFFISWI